MNPLTRYGTYKTFEQRHPELVEQFGNDVFLRRETMEEHLRLEHLVTPPVGDWATLVRWHEALHPEDA